MPAKLGTVVFKWLQGMMEYLLVFPVLLLFAVYFIPASPQWGWLTIFSALFLLGVIFRYLLPGKKRWLYMLVSGLLALGAVLLFHSSLWAVILTFLIGTTAAYRGTLYAARAWHWLFSSVYLWVVGLPVYFISYIVYRHVEALQHYLELISWLGVLLLAVTLYLSNSEHLKAATLSKAEQPVVNRALKRQNHFFVFLLLLVIGFLANIQAIRTILYNMLAGSIRSIVWFFSLWGSDEAPAQHSQPPAQMPPVLEESGETSLLMVWLERMLYIIAYALSIALILFLCYYLFKRLRILLNKGCRWLSNFLNGLSVRSNQEETTDDYVDETESSIDWQAWIKDQKGKTKQKVSALLQRQTPFNKLSDKEKVRYIYRRLLEEQAEKGYVFKPFYTPHQTLEELKKQQSLKGKELSRLEEVYGKVRYSGQEPDSGEIKELSSLVNK